MSVKEKVKEMIGSSLVEYDKLNVDNKTNINQLKFTEEYQNRIIRCMVGEVDDNYIETPETDAPIVKLENSREGLVKVPSIKGKTILVDIDGNETDTPAEGCKLVSVGEEEDNKLIILSNNANLCPINLYKSYIKPNGELQINGGNNRLTEYVKIKPNTRYSFECINQDGSNTNNYRLNVSWFDLDKNFIIQNTLLSRDDMVSPNGAGFVRVHRDDIPLKFRIQECNKNELSNEFVPHQSHKTEILLKEPLRSLPNGVCDEIIDNKLIRNTTQIIVVGTENLTRELITEEYIRYIIHVKGLGGNWSSYTDLISNYLIDNSTDAYYGTSPCIALDGAEQLYICLPKSVLKTHDKQGFIDYLKENNLQIIAPRKEPIIEELPNGITLQGFDDTTIYLENKITPTVTYGYNALIPFKEGAIAQEKKSKANAQDIDESIIPFMMDIEYQILTL